MVVTSSFAGLVVATVGLAAAPAGAHAQLVSTDPAHGEVLDVSPEQVVLEFSEAVQTPSDAVEVFDGAGDEVPVESVDGSGSDVSADLPELEDGPYVVSWHVISGDSHPISGAFLFHVGEPAGDESAEVLLDEVLADDGADKTLGVGYGVARFTVFVGLVLLVGGALFVTLLWPAGVTNPNLRRLIGAGWLVASVATLAAIGFQAAYGAGGSWGDMVDGELLADVLGGRTGRTWLVRLGLLAVLPLVWRDLFPPWRRFPSARGATSARVEGGAVPARPTQAVVVAVLGLALLATVSFAGHAATGDLVVAALGADVTHLVAAAFWLAGLGLLLAVALRSGRDAARDLVTRFSPLALGAVVVVVATGTFQSWRQVRSIDALTGTTYGRLLMGKVALFLVILAAAALSRQTVRGWVDSSQEKLRRSVGVETAVAVVLLAVTAVLVNTVPGRDAQATSTAGSSSVFEAESHGIELGIALTVDPAAAGPVEVDIQVITHGGEPLEVEEEPSASLSMEERSISRLELELEPGDGTGLYTAADAEIPFSGTWQLEVVVPTGDVDEERLFLDIPIS